jgi:hypothetical protein
VELSDKWIGAVQENVIKYNPTNPDAAAAMQALRNAQETGTLVKGVVAVNSPDSLIVVRVK